jgi:hypothetical protein
VAQDSLQSSSSPASPTDDEVLIAEILSAYSQARSSGPVRILFTDRRLVILWTGPHSILPRPTLYRAWMSSPGPSPPWRIGRTDFPAYGLEVAWDLPYLSIANLWVPRIIGPGAGHDVALLNLKIMATGLSGPAPLSFLGKPTGGLIFAVPGTREALRAFLQQTPLGGLVERGWLFGRRKLLEQHGARLP